MLKNYKLIGVGIIILIMALAVYLFQTESNLAFVNQVDQEQNQQAAGVVIAGEQKAVEVKKELNTFMIDDVKIGGGEAVKSGDTVAVHYVGKLQDGTEFDNSKKRGEPITFTVGAGQVIAGWEEGLIGMKKGGERVLIIPPEKAYGERGIGPIPPNATLEFTLELVDIK